MVCMSFVFNIGQGLPGRTLSSGRPIWLCNAQYADSKVFVRSLVAKSASIQTVVCFPFAGGVVELGATDLVSKDLGLIHRVKSSLSDTPKTIVPSKSIPVSGGTQNKDLGCPALGPQTLDTDLCPVLGCEQLETRSVDSSLDGIEPNQPAEDSSDCISQTFADHGDVIPLCQGENENAKSSQDDEECMQAKLSTLDPVSDDLHYLTVLSALLKSSHQLRFRPHFRNLNKESGFVNWKMTMNGLVKSRKAKDETPQKLLKKILFEVPRMHNKELLRSPPGNDVGDAVSRPEADEIFRNHVLLEGRRREKINNRFTALKSLVPSNSKADKISILDDTIEYLQDLERRVKELESCGELTELETRTKRKRRGHVERTSNNYGNKRKACDVDEAKQGIDYVASEDGTTDNLTVVTVNNKDFLIEFRCRWQDGILFEIMDALSFLDLDCHSVQSSTIEGILSVTIKSEYKGSTVAKAVAIKQALQRVKSLTFV